MKVCPECNLAEAHLPGCPLKNMTLVVETPHVVIACITALVITLAVLVCAGVAWKQFIDEWRADREAALVLAQYQIIAAETQADSFNSNPIPGALQCVQPKAAHADLVVQR